jgi:hypothetical protein
LLIARQQEGISHCSWGRLAGNAVVRRTAAGAARKLLLMVRV